MKKRIIIIFICILLILLLLFYALSLFTNIIKISDPKNTFDDIKSNDNRVSIVIWTVWSNPQAVDGNLRAFYQVLSELKKLMPAVDIQHEGVENESYKLKLKAAIAANEAPDIFYTWGSGFSKPFVDAGKVLALDEYLTDGTKEKLLEGATNNFSYDGKIYGLPYGQWVAVLYCNKELFEQNGLKLPETYEDLLIAIKGFRSKGIIPITVGAKEQWPLMFWQNAFALRILGAERVNNALAKKASFDTPEFIQSAALLKELVQLKAFDENALSITRDESQVPFLDGKIPMYYMGNWFTGDCEKEGFRVKGKIVAMKFPMVKNGKGTANEYLGGAIEGFMVNNNTKHKKIAVKILKYLAENMAKKSFMNGSSLPCWKIVVDDNSKINRLALEVYQQTRTAGNYVLAWDTYLEGEDAIAHKNLITDIYANKIMPEQFVKAMQLLNEKK